MLIPWRVILGFYLAGFCVYLWVFLDQDVEVSPFKDREPKNEFMLKFWVEEPRLKFV